MNIRRSHRRRSRGNKLVAKSWVPTVLRILLVSCLLWCSTAVCRERPLVECTGLVVPTVKFDSCKPGSSAFPIDVKVDGQRIGSIGSNRAPLGPFKYSNRQRRLESWAGKKEIEYQLLTCAVGEQREFALDLMHLGMTHISEGSGETPCKGSDCPIASGSDDCISEFSVRPLSITSRVPPAQTCSATIELAVEENSCARGLWDVPVEVRVAGHVVGSIEPGAHSFGPFPFAEPDPWVALWVGKRELASWYGMNCLKGKELALKFSSRHQQKFVSERTYLPCAGAECIETEWPYHYGNVCVSSFDLDRRDAPR